MTIVDVIVLAALVTFFFLLNCVGAYVDVRNAMSDLQEKEKSDG